MNNDKQSRIDALLSAIPELTAGQLHWVQRAVSVYAAAHTFILNKSDLFDEITLRNFGDAMRIHHGFSAEPFSKDKFEYVFVNVLKLSGQNAQLAPKGNPGHDVTVDGVQLSLKTQADKNIKEDSIWVSKFMELGKGDWGDNPADLNGLRSQYLGHMANYDRIFILRALQKAPRWRYELVEIPLSILQLAKDGELEMKLASRQFPKPGYCHVRNEQGDTVFSLYFDGGGERKLQIRNLNKAYCRVHAQWLFFIPSD